LVRRFAPIEQLRFCNSGTEATMDALRLARAHVGRDKIVKIEGSYHGHHDAVLMSTKPPIDAAGPVSRPNSVPASKGIPSDVKNNTIIAPYNDAEALERILTEHEGEVAAVITEAVLMNVGIMLPEEGYLESVREITRRHGVLLIFDEVKTGVTVAPGGITELYPVEPDLICLAKSIGGGMPIGVFGGREEVMRHINHQEVVHLGTFNGNPMSMRAGLVTLTQIFTPEAHAHAIGLSKQLGEGYVWDIDMHLSYAYWLFLANRGILFPPGFDDQWTVSIQHTQADIDHHLHVFHQFVSELTR
ncbi:MAG: aminotransferase class III-fold pyridoxal phosphate-dependent enzyme, partial [Chloroflexi bacterium]